MSSVLDLLDSIPEEKLDSIRLDEDTKATVIEYSRRRREEPIRYFTPNPGAQVAFFEAVKTYREIALLGGNKLGKTCVGGKYVSHAALGARAKRYGLEQYFPNKIDIWVGTGDYKLQRETIQPEILKWIPQAEIKKIYHMQGGVIDKIDLDNGSTLGFKTYDQGRKSWQGPVRRIILLDEEPPADIVEEARARLTLPGAQLIFTMTPLLGFTQVYKDFVEISKPWRKMIVGSTYENRANVTEEYLASMEAMDELTKQMRLFGNFVKMEGLVYKEFNRSVHVIDHMEPDIKRFIFSGGMDFGATHFTAFVLAGTDIDGNIYIFDEYKEAGLGFDEYAEGWKNMISGYKVARLFRDPSAKQAGIEFRQRGIKTVPGVNDRAVGISLITQLLKSGKLFISSRCIQLIDEFEHHRYQKAKVGQKDADVIKTEDDLLDALRYMIASLFKLRPKEAKVFSSNKPVAGDNANW